MPGLTFSLIVSVNVTTVGRSTRSVNVPVMMTGGGRVVKVMDAVVDAVRVTVEPPDTVATTVVGTMVVKVAALVNVNVCTTVVKTVLVAGMVCPPVVIKVVVTVGT